MSIYAYRLFCGLWAYVDTMSKYYFEKGNFTMNELRKKQYELEQYADIMERLDNSEQWYQHTDEGGNWVDDEDTNSVLHLAAIRSIKKQILKLAGC